MTASPPDPYSGNVVPGGAPATRRLRELEIVKLSVGPHDNNAYLLRCRRTASTLLVDAADEPDRLLTQLVGAGGLHAVLTTHLHADHWQALEAVVATTGAVTVAGRIDAPGLPIASDRLVDEGDRIAVGECELEVIQLAGHTPGGIALLYLDPAGPPHLFTGDSLFPGGVGNTGGDPARFKQLMTEVVEKVFDRLPDQTWVYPGHGNDTTIGVERPHLEEWWDRGW